MAQGCVAAVGAAVTAPRAQRRAFFVEVDAEQWRVTEVHPQSLANVSGWSEQAPTLHVAAQLIRHRLAVDPRG